MTEIYNDIIVLHFESKVYEVKKQQNLILS